MIMKIFCFYDKEKGVFSRPMFLQFDKDDVIEMYQRELGKDTLNDLDSFDLYYLGTFDDNLGHIDFLKPEFCLTLKGARKHEDAK